MKQFSFFLIRRGGEISGEHSSVKYPPLGFKIVGLAETYDSNIFKI